MSKHNGLSGADMAMARMTMERRGKVRQHGGPPRAPSAQTYNISFGGVAFTQDDAKRNAARFIEGIVMEQSRRRGQQRPLLSPQPPAPTMPPPRSNDYDDHANKPPRATKGVFARAWAWLKGERQ